MATADEVLGRMLRRLPPSLWDTDPASATVQRDLYAAMASQVAVWLEQREIARQCTLMLEAEGVDLDTLLEDYGLRRYLGLPDAYARQVGMHILWYPKGTLHSVQRLADLLFSTLPHATLRTGRSHEHVFVAATHPVTTPHSYWGLVSADGRWYALTIDAMVPTISERPPPGLDVSPGSHTLTWLTVQDETGADWIVSIHDNTLRVDTTPPPGHGTTEPFTVLDGHGNRWHLQVQSGTQELVSILDTGLPGLGYWHIRAHTGTVYALWIAEQVPTIDTTAPGGSTDQTPGGVPLDWFTVEDGAGTPWYVTIQDATLFLQATVPGGSGTATLAEFLDASGQRWVLTAAGGTLVATAVNPLNANEVVVAPDAPFQAFQLLDSAGIAWWVFVDAHTLRLATTFPGGAQAVTPAGGPYRWWRLYDRTGALWYAWPSTLGELLATTTSPGGLGTAVPQTLGDRFGVLWHAGVNSMGEIGVSDAPPISYGGRSTAICLTDAAGGHWFWRIDAQVLEWSPTLWPDSIDQSPWGALGWLQVRDTTGETRYVFPTPLGDPRSAPAPPIGSPWGWSQPFTFYDTSGTPWHLEVRPEDDIGVASTLPDDLPLASDALSLSEALEAFAHVQAAGSLITLLVT